MCRRLVARGGAGRNVLLGMMRAAEVGRLHHERRNWRVFALFCGVGESVQAVDELVRWRDCRCCVHGRGDGGDGPVICRASRDGAAVICGGVCECLRMKWMHCAVAALEICCVGLPVFFCRASCKGFLICYGADDDGEILNHQCGSFGFGSRFARLSPCALDLEACFFRHREILMMSSAAGVPSHRSRELAWRRFGLLRQRRDY